MAHIVAKVSLVIVAHENSDRPYLCHNTISNLQFQEKIVNKCVRGIMEVPYFGLIQVKIIVPLLLVLMFTHICIITVKTTNLQFFLMFQDEMNG